MSGKHGAFAAALLATGCITATTCAPLRVDERPQIRGTFVTVDGSTVGLRHKTGRTYRIEVTPDTRIVNSRQPGDVMLCPGQRATVFLAGTSRFTASSITLWSGRCK